MENVIQFVCILGVPVIVALMWGVFRTTNESDELTIMLYDNCIKKVRKEFKKKESLQRADIEELIKDVKATKILSHSKMEVKDPKTFTNILIEYMLKRKVVEERIVEGKKVYFLK